MPSGIVLHRRTLKPAPPPAPTLPVSLAAYWEFETTGWLDATGHGNNMAGSGGPGVSAGLVGNAVNLASVGNQYLINYSPVGVQLSAGSLFEFQGWVKASSFGADRTIYYQEATAGTTAFKVDYATASNRFRLTVGTTTLLANTFGAPAGGPTAWYFISAGQDATNMFISVDNGSLDTAPRVACPTGVPYMMGLGVTESLTNFWNGSFDQFGLWIGRALTPAERTYCRNAGAGRTYAQIAAASP
jgi:hypothetical protein